MKHKIISASIAVMSLCACSVEHNPLLDNEFDTPFNLPPFGEIRNNCYIPAFEDAIKEADNTIALIVENRAEPTFQNTIVPLDRSGMKLSRVSAIFFNLMETDVTDTMNVMAVTILPMLSEHSDEVAFNARLFERIKHVHDNKETAGLDSVQLRVLDLYYKDFIRNGALLPAAKKQRLKEINSQLSLLSHQFGSNLLAETNDSYRLVIDSAADLAGLPENLVLAAADKAAELGMKGKWVFTLHNASIMPFLQNSERHELRKSIYDAYCRRGRNGGEHDNREIVRKMIALRIEKAQMLGYKTYAHFAIEENMAATPEAVDSFLAVVWPHALAKAKSELEDLKKFAYKYDKTTVVESCDWAYWTEKLRKAQYDLDETEISQYFELNSVRDGMFRTATKLYGITFKKVTDAPLYNQDDNEVWQVMDVDGKSLGVVYFDWHPRASKGGGAWCTTFREPIDNFDGTHTQGQVSIVCNFTKGANGQPDLLTYDEYLTMFHEFGHAIQSLFTKGYYVRTAGNVPGDYVEMPSQINEKWAADSAVIKSFARHYKTGEVIPDALLQKINRASLFNQGFASTEYLAAALLDMRWHSLTDKDNVPDVDKFESKALAEMGLIREIESRYHTTYFAHIFDGGYSAGYYDYEWSEMLVCDAFAAFKETGDIFNKEVVSRFRKYALSEVGDGDLMEQYVRFRGARPSMEYLMKSRGFVNTQPAQKTKDKPKAKTVHAKSGLSSDVNTKE